LGVLRGDADLNALLITKGHPFERDAFFKMFESWSDIACTAVEQPAAQAFFDPELARSWDAFVFYDMPGIEFRPDGPVFHDPPAQLKENFLELIEAGQGLVFLHHALAGWPTWPEYADILGGRFLYRPASLRGAQWPDSGYRHEISHRVSVVDPKHPVVAGLGEGFEILDEVYLCPVFEADVVPLLRSDHAFVDSNFYSSARAVRGEMFSREGWSHPPGSNLIGWAQRRGRSPIVTLTCGDGPDAYANPAFRKLVGNAIRWVASPEAHKWAAEATEP
jgi:type 1 glutamine amidotransferase